MDDQKHLPEGFQELPEEEPDFKEWLYTRYGYIPLELYLLCQKTGSRGDYGRVMEWYRRRYCFEMQRNQLYNNNNPFLQEE